MKLNLLPTTVSRASKSRTAWIVSSLMMIAGIGAAAALMTISRGQLESVKAEVNEARPKAENAYQISVQADEIVAKAEGVIRNTKLASAMIQHNNAYPALYENLMKWNPPFFRWTSITASPVDAENATVTITGTLTTYQQYADLMLALMRNPIVNSVSRQGFVSTDKIVPPLVPTDQVGKPRKAGETPIPDDPLERLAYFQAQGQAPDFVGAGNFGSGTQAVRLAKPGDSLVTVQMAVKAQLQVPNARGTLQAGGGAPGAGGGAGAPAAGAPAAGGPAAAGAAGGK